MKTIGIIAEYNPFHLGHEYQIRQIRKNRNADCIVAVISGDFVQRGIPAWTDKYLRTEMALAGGADMVFELPVHYAVASAEGFAYGGVSLLHSLGFVDEICFGSECGDIETLQRIADVLLSKQEEIQTAISLTMKKGENYPSAREQVIRKLLPSVFEKNPDILNRANNILAIEYLKALKKMNCHMKATTIPRNGAHYHEQNIDMQYASANAIRQYYRQNGFLPPEKLPNYVQMLLEVHPERFPIEENDFSDLLYYRLRLMDERALDILDMTVDLYQRIQNRLSSYKDAESFIECIASKNYTKSRVSRVLLHLLLELYPIDASPSYARLLGFSHSCSHLLRAPGQIPVITKAADADRVLLSSDAKETWNADIRAHDLYRYVLKHKYPDAELPDDYHADVCIY